MIERMRVKMGEDFSGEREISKKVYSRFDFEVVIEDFTFVIKKSYKYVHIDTCMMILYTVKQVLIKY